MLRKAGYGVVLWAIPYAVAVPLLPLMRSDQTFFKTIMVVCGAAVGGALAAHYFRTVERDFLREGLVLGLVWIAVNWLLDAVALLPFAGLTVARYFLEIGLRYLAILPMTLAIGYVLERRSGR